MHLLPGITLAPEAGHSLAVPDGVIIVQSTLNLLMIWCQHQAGCGLQQSLSQWAQQQRQSYSIGWLTHRPQQYSVGAGFDIVTDNAGVYKGPLLRAIQAKQA